eukprot:CAMPEP_0113882494 /NCGR_PEP_ID=MMETSP0780_2-20120614/8994_1 /TAXON_ID=652834 /ORGANISM="Palpitomonas bilix" /LENGTH=601 /DNA_ID=CAMNT_0000869531 /DNA_START=687 /DNA_END=2492 /DNA_ORIENTATION=- /assembly_acc=CAM_ASM_000599
MSTFFHISALAFPVVLFAISFRYRGEMEKQGSLPETEAKTWKGVEVVLAVFAFFDLLNFFGLLESVPLGQSYVGLLSITIFTVHSIFWITYYIAYFVVMVIVFCLSGFIKILYQFMSAPTIVFIIAQPFLFKYAVSIQPIAGQPLEQAIETRIARDFDELKKKIQAVTLSNVADTLSDLYFYEEAARKFGKGVLCFFGGVLHALLSLANSTRGNPPHNADQSLIAHRLTDVNNRISNLAERVGRESQTICNTIRNEVRRQGRRRRQTGEDAVRIDRSSFTFINVTSIQRGDISIEQNQVARQEECTRIFRSRCDASIPLLEGKLKLRASETAQAIAGMTVSFSELDSLGATIELTSNQNGEIDLTSLSSGTVYQISTSRTERYQAIQTVAQTPHDGDNVENHPAGVKHTIFIGKNLIPVCKDCSLEQNRVVYESECTNPIHQLVSPQKFVLRWGENPRDLDSHLAWKTEAGESRRVYFSKKVYEDEPLLWLDKDVTTGFGPETMTTGCLRPGITYHYFVHNYAGKGTLSGCRGEVIVTDVYGTCCEVIVPSQGEGDYWHVFDIDGTSQKVTLVDKIIKVSEYNRITGQNGQSDGAGYEGEV